MHLHDDTKNFFLSNAKKRANNFLQITMVSVQMDGIILISNDVQSAIQSTNFIHKFFKISRKFEFNFNKSLSALV